MCKWINRKYFYRNSSSYRAIICIAIASACAVAAQAEDGAQIEEITVTAQRQAKDLQSVPASVLPFTANAIAKLNALNLDDLQKAAPGLTFAVNARTTVGQLGIRGVVDYSSTPGYDARVGVYLDGVYIKRSFADDQTLLGVDRVEVLRGPQGTTFGMNTDAGAISIVTKKPGDEFAAELSIDGGSFDYLRFQGRVEIPVDSALSAALSLSQESSGGYIENVYRGGKQQGTNRLSGRAQLRYRPSADLDVNLSYTHLVEHNTPVWAEGIWTDAKWKSFQQLYPQYAKVPNPGNYQVADSLDQYENGSSNFLIGTVDWRLNSLLTLTSISAYQYEEFTEVQDATDLPALGRYYNLNQSASQFSQEVRIASDPARDLSIVAGAYFQDGRNGSSSQYFAGPDFAALLLWSNGVPVASVPAAVSISPYRFYNNSVVSSPSTVDDTSYAVFALATYRLGNLEASAGVRYSSTSKTLRDYSLNDPLAANPATAPYAAYANFSNVGDKRTFSNVSPKVSLAYQLADDVTVYGSYGQGFKAGGWNTSVISAATYAAGLRLDSETVSSYEAGLKTEFFDHRLRANVEGFVEKFSNFQVTQWTPSLNGVSAPKLANAAKATSQGVEAEVDAIPLHGLTLSARVSYTDAHFNSYPNCTGANSNCDGKKLPYAPEAKLYLSAVYEFAAFSFADAMAGVEYSTQTDSYSNVDNGSAEYIPASHSIDARAGLNFTGGNWALTFYARNLENRANQTYSQSGAFGDRIVFHTPPRNFGLSLSAKF